jgi:hypothetical protein
VLLVFATARVAFALLDLPPSFPPLPRRARLLHRDAAVGLGVLVFVGCVMWSSRPITLYRWIALVALALSMIPDALLPGNVPGATWPAASC